MVADVKPAPKVSKRVHERDCEGKCLQCDKPAERRGLCIEHYFRFRTEIQKLPLADRPVFETRQIRSGKILRARTGQRVAKMRAEGRL